MNQAPNTTTLHTGTAGNYNGHLECISRCGCGVGKRASDSNLERARLMKGAHQMYFVTSPVVGGYAFYNVTRRVNGEIQHVATIHKDMPNAAEEAGALCVRLNERMLKEIREKEEKPQEKTFNVSRFTDSISLGLKFKSIEDEEWRRYDFLDGKSGTMTLVLEDPVALAVSESGSHRIFTADGISHYIPAGWAHLYWKVKPGKKPFAF